MKILFDQGVPVPLRQFLAAHTVSTAWEPGWSTLKNGDILTTAETNGYEIFVTTDQNLRYQQNLAHRTIAIVVLCSEIRGPRSGDSLLIFIKTGKRPFSVIRDTVPGTPTFPQSHIVNIHTR